MINQDKEETSLSIHRLVQEVTRINSKKEEEETLEKSLSLLKKYGIENCTRHVISVWEYASEHKELIEKIIVESVNKKALNYFHLIVKSSSYEVVEKIINSIKDPKKLRALITVTDANKKTPLHYAAEGGNEKQ